jgi:hypothetical protein
MKMLSARATWLQRSALVAEQQEIKVPIDLTIPDFFAAPFVDFSSLTWRHGQSNRQKLIFFDVDWYRVNKWNRCMEAAVQLDVGCPADDILGTWGDPKEIKNTATAELQW